MLHKNLQTHCLVSLIILALYQSTVKNYIYRIQYDLDCLTGMGGGVSGGQLPPLPRLFKILKFIFVKESTVGARIIRTSRLFFFM